MKNFHKINLVDRYMRTLLPSSPKVGEYFLAGRALETRLAGCAGLEGSLSGSCKGRVHTCRTLSASASLNTAPRCFIASSQTQAWDEATEVRRAIGNLGFHPVALFTVIDKEPPCRNILVDSQGRKHFCMTDVLAVPMATSVTLVEDNRPIIFCQ